MEDIDKDKFTAAANTSAGSTSFGNVTLGNITLEEDLREQEADDEQQLQQEDCTSCIQGQRTDRKGRSMGGPG